MMMLPHFREPPRHKCEHYYNMFLKIITCIDLARVLISGHFVWCPWKATHVHIRNYQGKIYTITLLKHYIIIFYFRAT